MSRCVGIAFIVTCVAFGVGLLVFDNAKRNKSKEPTCTPVHPETAVETWTDPETGHRFAVSYRRWRDGVGICLIPEREEENDCPVPALAEKGILESTVGWKEIQ